MDNGRDMELCNGVGVRGVVWDVYQDDIASKWQQIATAIFFPPLLGRLFFCSFDCYEANILRSGSGFRIVFEVVPQRGVTVQDRIHRRHA